MAKPGKAPGPNQIPIEAIKWLDAKNIKYAVTLFNAWFNGEPLPTEALQATVVQIYKKGDSTNHANYRPISLLNSLYKVYATILRERLAEK